MTQASHPSRSQISLYLGVLPTFCFSQRQKIVKMLLLRFFLPGHLDRGPTHISPPSRALAPAGFGYLATRSLGVRQSGKPTTGSRTDFELLGRQSLSRSAASGERAVQYGLEPIGDSRSEGKGGQPKPIPGVNIKKMCTMHDIGKSDPVILSYVSWM